MSLRRLYGKDPIRGHCCLRGNVSSFMHREAQGVPSRWNSLQRRVPSPAGWVTWHSTTLPGKKSKHGVRFHLGGSEAVRRIWRWGWGQTSTSAAERRPSARGWWHGLGAAACERMFNTSGSWGWRENADLWRFWISAV